MATINIANLTFTHKGDYDGSTAYVKNDVVYYSTNGNAYIAKQGTTGNVPTNGTYWSQFAAGSGGIWNAGLSLGSAGQAVKVNSGGNALEFGTISSDFVRLGTATASSSANIDFDGLFTSDYNIYKIFFHNVVHSSQSADMYIRFMQGGSAITSSTYNYHVNQEGYNDGGINSAGVTGAYPSNSDSKIRLNGDGILTTANYHASGMVEIYHPLEATAYKCVIGKVHHFTASKCLLSNFFGRNQTTSALSGIQFLPQAGNMTSGKFYLYGMKSS
mgnify:CR=1 FL=1